MGIYNEMFGTKQEVDEFYETYLQKYQNDVYRFLLRYVKHHETAEDLMQETMCAAMRKLHQLSTPANSRVWLLAIAKNEALGYIRKESRRPTLIALDEYPLEWLETRPSAEEEAERNCERALVDEAKKSLAHETAQIIELHMEQELTFEEIAKIMELPMKTVASRYYRGVKAMNAYLKKVL